MVFLGGFTFHNFKIKFLPLEYTFKNSLREEAQTVVLNVYSITVSSANSEYNISYANITTVRLCKVTPTFYKTIIHHDGNKPLTITNQFISEDGVQVDRSRMYSTFIRVLHYHLKDKSASAYTSGCNITSLWKWGVFSIIASFILSFTLDYLGFGLVNPYLLTLILTFLIAAIVVVRNVGQWPREYTATDIPITLLP
jgi:hypothetical protein